MLLRPSGRLLLLPLLELRDMRREPLADLREKDPDGVWTLSDAQARAILASNICPRARWVPLLAKARDAALRRVGASIRDTLRNELGTLKRAWPGPSVGIHPGMVPHLLADYGNDVVINAGGGIHGHPDGAAAGSTG